MDKESGANNSILARFDCDLSLDVDRDFFKRNNLRFNEETYFQKISKLENLLVVIETGLIIQLTKLELYVVINIATSKIINSIEFFFNHNIETKSILLKIYMISIKKIVFRIFTNKFILANVQAKNYTIF